MDAPLAHPLLNKHYVGCSASPKGNAVTIHNATTSTEEASVKMKEAPDQSAELLQSLQPKIWFNESSFGPQISSGLKSWGREIVWHKPGMQYWWDFWF